MTIRQFIPIFLLSAHCLWAQKIELTVLDEQTQDPISGAKAHAIYDNPYSPDRYDEQIKHTDEEGRTQFFGVGKLGASLRVSKEGYYGFGVHNAEDFRFSSSELEGGVEKTVKLRPIVKPTALYATRTQPGRYASEAETTIPVFREWCGYDFEVGDWVAPHGSGKVTDILIMFDREFIDFEKTRFPVEVRREAIEGKYKRLGKKFTEEAFRVEAGLWNLTFKVSFPNEKEGLVLVDDEFNEHSVLRMPHEAHDTGYVPSYGYQITSEEYLQRKDDIGFFLRIRVVLDEKGEIESANYAKIHEDFEVTVDGKIKFAYYFNPVPNDRNLEFDPKQNLFPKGTPGTLNFVLP